MESATKTQFEKHKEKIKPAADLAQSDLAALIEHCAATEIIGCPGVFREVGVGRVYVEGFRGLRITFYMDPTGGIDSASLIGQANGSDWSLGTLTEEQCLALDESLRISEAYREI
jgi:hypothetical protein